MSKNEADLKEFEDALEAHKTKGEENQDLEKKVQKSKKKATKSKAKRERHYLSLEGSVQELTLFE